MLSTETAPRERHNLLMRVNDQIIDLEVQAEYREDFLKRADFYRCRQVVAPLRAGLNELPPVTLLSICGFSLFPGQDFRTRLGPVDRSLLADPDSVADPGGLDFLELPKVPALDGPASRYRDTPAGRTLAWSALFRARTDEDLTAVETIGIPAVSMTSGELRQVRASGQASGLLREEETHLAG